MMKNRDLIRRLIEMPMDAEIEDVFGDKLTDVEHKYDEVSNIDRVVLKIEDKG